MEYEWRDTRFASKLQDYYDNERFYLLKTRAERILADIEKLLQEILEKYTSEILDRLEIGGDLLLEIKDRIEDFTKKVSILIRCYQNQIANDKPFSNALTNDIEKIYAILSEVEESLKSKNNPK